MTRKWRTHRDRGRRTSPPRNAVAKPEETLAPIGHIERSGVIGKGDGVHSRLEFRETPDGHHLGFRLVIDADKAIPQVVAQGPIGNALFALGDPEKLLGTKVDVEGDLFEVHFPGRRTYHRLYLTRIVSEDWVIPANVEAASVPLFDDPAEEEAVMAGMDKAERKAS